MNSETIAVLVKFLPTILSVIIIFLCMIRGLMRGFRKSVILLLHYIISIAAGLAIYFKASAVVLSNELNSILVSLSPDFAEANSLYDVIKILLESYLPDFAALANNQYLQQIIMAVVGLGVSLALGIVCLVLIPWVIRFLLYVLYLLFYREGKVKKHKIAEGDEYNPHRFLGMFVGAARGVVCSLVTVTFITSIYFVLSGGITPSEETEAESIDLLTTLGDDLGLDLNAIYRGLKESRTTGIGAVFNSIVVEGKPIDLYYSDLFLTSKFTTYPKKEETKIENTSFLTNNEEIQGELAELCIREELTLVVNLLEGILESNALTIVDGNINLDQEKLSTEIKVMVNDFVEESVLLSEITPLAIVGVAEAIQSGDLVVDQSIRDILTDEVLNEIKELDIVSDLSELINIAITTLELIPVKENGSGFDLEALKDPNTLLNFDVDKVKLIFESLGNVETLTKVVFPVGIGIVLESMAETIEAAGISPSELDFKDTIWSNELVRIGLIYERVAALKLDVNALMDATINEETGVSHQLEYIIDLCTNEQTSPKFKEDLVLLIDEIFKSELFSQVGLVVVKSSLAEFDVIDEEGNPTPLSASIDLIKTNLEHYTVESLRADLHELASSCLNVTSLLPLILTGGTETADEEFAENIFSILDGIKTADVKVALLGENLEDGSYKGGLYSLRLLTGDIDGIDGTDEGCSYAIDAVIEGALKTFAGEFISSDIVDSITSIDVYGETIKLEPTDKDYDFNAWPNELSSLLDAVGELKEVECLKEIDFAGLHESSDFTKILPESITYEDIDIITGAASKTKILSSFIDSAIVTNLKDIEMLGDVVSDSSIVWMDKYDSEGNIVRGELNALLKAFIILSDEEKGINLEDENSLINGLAQLLYEADQDSLSNNVVDGLDYEDVIVFAKSKVVMKLLSDKVAGLGSNGEAGVMIVIPNNLDSSKNDLAWEKWSQANNDYKQGEFANLVTVLYYAREYALTKQDTVNVSEEETPLTGLTLGNLVDSMVYMDHDDAIIKSLVLYATLSHKIVEEDNNSEENNSVVKIRQTALYTQQEADATNNGILLKAIEVDRALDVVRYLELDLAGSNIGNIDLQVIKEKVGNEKVRESLCISNVFNISAINKVTLTPSVVTHGKYKDGDTINLESDYWYPNEDDLSTWYNCELNKLLMAIKELDIPVVNNQFVFDDITSLIKNLNEGSFFDDNKTKLEVVYSSDTLAATISKEITKKDEVDIQQGFIDSYGVVDGDEVSKLIDFLNFADIDLKTKIDLQTIVNLLNNHDKYDDEETYSEGTIRRISQSNILNITVVNKLYETVTATDVLTLPEIYKSTLYTGWYPASDATWENCELSRLLSGIAEMNVGATGDTINFEINSSIDNLLVVNSSGKTKLAVVYESDVFAMTISKYLRSQEALEIPTLDNRTLETGVNSRDYVIYDLTDTRGFEDKIIRLIEVENLLKALLTKTSLGGLGVSFEKGFDLLGDNAIEVSVLKANINSEVSILNSSILHYLFSQSLLQQKQKTSDNENPGYSIVTDEYYKDQNTKDSSWYAKSHKEGDTTYKDVYIKKSEIIYIVDSLEKLGISSVDCVSEINSQTLIELFGTQDRYNANKSLADDITNSIILSKIFGQILISQGFAGVYQTKTVKEYNSDTEVSILTQSDISLILKQIGELN